MNFREGPPPVVVVADLIEPVVAEQHKVERRFGEHRHVAGVTDDECGVAKAAEASAAGLDHLWRDIRTDVFAGDPREIECRAAATDAEVEQPRRRPAPPVGENASLRREELARRGVERAVTGVEPPVELFAPGRLGSYAHDRYRNVAPALHKASEPAHRQEQPPPVTLRPVPPSLCGLTRRFNARGAGFARVRGGHESSSRQRHSAWRALNASSRAARRAGRIAARMPATTAVVAAHATRLVIGNANVSPWTAMAFVMTPARKSGSGTRREQ
jgi:hypothetical protein